MRLRSLSIAVLLAAVSCGLTWLSLQPILFRLFAAIARAHPGERPLLAHTRALLPWHLGLDLALVSGFAYLLLLFLVIRPLERAEQSVARLRRNELELPSRGGGPLLSGFQGSLEALAGALKEEKALTRSQLEALSRTNQQLVQAQTELVASERLATVGKLAAGVAHEIGNPLSGVLGYLSLSRDRARDDERLLDYLDRIEQELQRVSQIVRGLLDLGRPVRGQRGPVVVASLAETCAKLVQADPELRRVQIELAVEPDAVVRGESGPLSQVLLNLLLNAAQAMGGEGTIRLATRTDADAVVISVEDEGPGIPEENLPHLFEPFFTTKAQGKGTGLGLAVSRHLARSLGGVLSAENREGGGARFLLTLPKA